MDNLLKIKQRTVYGQTWYYPACDKSQALARISGEGTLTVAALNIIKNDLKFNIEITRDYTVDPSYLHVKRA